MFIFGVSGFFYGIYCDAVNYKSYNLTCSYTVLQLAEQAYAVSGWAYWCYATDGIAGAYLGISG